MFLPETQSVTVPTLLLVPTRRSSDLPRLLQRDRSARERTRDVVDRRGRSRDATGRRRRRELRRVAVRHVDPADRKSTRLNSSHLVISYAVFCLKNKIL